MILSERGAIRAAIAGGGFHLYPAGKLIDIIKAQLAGDDLKGNFDPASTAEKLSRVVGPQDGPSRELFCRDLKLLCDRLSAMEAEYDIDAVFDRMLTVMPAMAKRYYGIDGFEAPRPRIVEYFFEGFNDLYMDGDWNAFNVDQFESRELNVPVGTYFKRSQVSPGQPEYGALHEANHAMQEAVGMHDVARRYVSWMDEGLADILARMMLFRATGDETLMWRIKNFRTEVEVIDPRKVTYHYGEQIAALMLLRGRLPFVKALIRLRGREPFAIDWDMLALKVKDGWDPHIALVTAYKGSKPDPFRKRLEREEAKFRKEADLDQLDLRILGMFLATQVPACISATEYLAALWLVGEVARRPSPHAVDPQAIPTEARAQVLSYSEVMPIPASSIPEAIWKKYPGIEIKLLIRDGDVPQNLREGVEALASKYFILKRKIGDAVVYEPYGGGLPHRLATGELRCTY